MYLLPILLDLMCILHIVRTGRDRVWIFVVLAIPLIGGLAYAAFEMVPDFLRSYRGQKLRSHALNAVAPARNLKRHESRLEVADTVQNRMRLAEEHLRLGRPAEAAEIYRSTLTGVYADDVALLMGLARATATLELHGEALDALDRLRAAHPEYQSTEAHLIYARSLEGLGRIDEAESEYAVLVGYAPGEEARARYALLLEAKGRQEEAKAVYEDILKRAKHASRSYLKSEKQWIDLARRNESGV